MKKSLVREKMKKGELILSAAMCFVNPRIAELIGTMGFDCLWICNEHGASDLSEIENSVRACRLSGMDSMVRVGYGSHANLIQVLEMGASGLMLPRVQSVEETEEIVRQTRFFPIGQRGISGGGTDADLGGVAIKDYIRFANDNTFLCIQIEDMKAVDQVEKIAAIKGVDIIFVGPTDLSQDLGCPGELKHPAVIEAIKRTACACEKNGIYCGTPGLDLDYSKKLINYGVKFLTNGADLGILRSGYKDLREKYSELGFSFRSNEEYSGKKSSAYA